MYIYAKYNLWILLFSPKFLKVQGMITKIYKILRENYYF